MVSESSAEYFKKEMVSVLAHEQTNRRCDSAERYLSFTIPRKFWQLLSIFAINNFFQRGDEVLSASNAALGSYRTYTTREDLLSPRTRWQLTSKWE